MNLALQIEKLRQRHWAGDASARIELHDLLLQDLDAVLRRALGADGVASPIVALVRRLVPNLGDGGAGMSLDFRAISRKLCDVLLSRPAASPRRDQATETQRFAHGTVALRC